MIIIRGTITGWWFHMLLLSKVKCLPCSWDGIKPPTRWGFMMVDIKGEKWRGYLSGGLVNPHELRVDKKSHGNSKIRWVITLKMTCLRWNHGLIFWCSVCFSVLYCLKKFSDIEGKARFPFGSEALHWKTPFIYFGDFYTCSIQSPCLITREPLIISHYVC